MNASRRARQKHNRYSGGGHTVTAHKQEPDPDHAGKMRNIRCLVCRPLPKTWDRGLAGKAVRQ